MPPWGTSSINTLVSDAFVRGPRGPLPTVTSGDVQRAPSSELLLPPSLSRKASNHHDVKVVVSHSRGMPVGAVSLRRWVAKCQDVSAEPEGARSVGFNI